MINTTPSKNLTAIKKKTRTIVSFEVDSDVAKMFERCAEAGIIKSFVCNTACREYLTIKGYSRKRDLAKTSK